MRFISWNCGSGFHRKIEALLALAPDVAIVQECADLDMLARKAHDFAPTGALWTGARRDERGRFLPDSDRETGA